jgi:hypothetical protein
MNVIRVPELTTSLRRTEFMIGAAPERVHFVVPHFSKERKPMANHQSYPPGEMVKNLLNQWGIVLSKEQFSKIKRLVKEGRKPGRHFAPGCCSNPDYIIQIPVLFEDDTYDIMKAMNLKKPAENPHEKRTQLQELLHGYTGNG